MDVPFVIPALTFPWDIFHSIEQEYYQHLYDSLREKRMNRSNKTFNANDSTLGLELPTAIEQAEDPSKVGRSRSGRKPHDFMPMMRAFELARLLYVESMAESVYLQVLSNPLFAEACGFTGKLPSYRSFARFDQIMTDFGLWEKARQRVIAFNLKQGVLELEDTLVADTTHVEAEATYGKQMKTCGHKENCDCPKIPTDDNVGIVRKSNTVSYVGHKVSLLSGAKGQLPLTREVCKGGEYDAFTLQPTLERFKSEFEELAEPVQYVLADGIYQTPGNQKVTKDVLGAKLLAPINPRNRKDKSSDARTGIERIIGMLKDGYSLRRVHKRGRKAVEAHVDQCILCMHVMAYCAHAQTGTVNRRWTRNRLKRAQ